jgi:hypothetical protein
MLEQARLEAGATEAAEVEEFVGELGAFLA